jgi:hypothetical protein
VADLVEEMVAEGRGVAGEEKDAVEARDAVEAKGGEDHLTVVE